MSLAAWVCYLPEVHPFLLDTAQTVDRTIARFEGRIGVLQAELAQLPATLAVEGDLSGNRAERAKLTAYRQEIVEYQATISECRKQLEAQVARRWTAAEIAHAKSRAGASVRRARGDCLARPSINRSSASAPRRGGSL